MAERDAARSPAAGREIAAAAPATVDVHAHFLPPAAVEILERPDLVALVRDGYGSRVVVRGSVHLVPEGLVDQARLLEDMEARGLQQRWLAGPPFLFLCEHAREDAVAWARAFNDAIVATAEASQGRLLPVATLPIAHPEAAEGELERILGNGVRAVQIPTRTPVLELDDDHLERLWSLASEAGAVFLVHPHYLAGRYGDNTYHLRNLVGNPLETTWTAVRLAAAGVLRRNPGARFVLAHGGGALPFLRGRIAHGAGVRANVPDDLARDLHGFTFDSIVFDPDVLELLVRWAGPERVAFGTDYPFDMADPLGPRERLAALGAEAAGWVAGRTAARLLDARSVHASTRREAAMDDAGGA